MSYIIKKMVLLIRSNIVKSIDFQPKVLFWLGISINFPIEWYTYAWNLSQKKALEARWWRHQWRHFLSFSEMVHLHFWNCPFHLIVFSNKNEPPSKCQVVSEFTLSKKLLSEQTVHGFKLLLPSDRGRFTRSGSVFGCEPDTYQAITKHVSNNLRSILIFSFSILGVIWFFGPSGFVFSMIVSTSTSTYRMKRGNKAWKS